MAATKQDRVTDIARAVSFMEYQMGQDWDYYYPSYDDLDRLGTPGKDGKIEYSDNDIAFLIWTLRPYDPENISEDQKDIMQYAAQLLSDYADDYNPNER